MAVTSPGSSADTSGLTAPDGTPLTDSNIMELALNAAIPLATVQAWDAAHQSNYAHAYNHYGVSQDVVKKAADKAATEGQAAFGIQPGDYSHFDVSKPNYGLNQNDFGALLTQFQKAGGNLAAIKSTFAQGSTIPADIQKYVGGTTDTSGGTTDDGGIDWKQIFGVNPDGGTGANNIYINNSAAGGTAGNTNGNQSGGQGTGTGTLRDLIGAGTDLAGWLLNHSAADSVQRDQIGAVASGGQSVGSGVLGAIEQVQRGTQGATAAIQDALSKGLITQQQAADAIAGRNTAAIGQIRADNQPAMDAGNKGLMALKDMALAPNDASAVSAEALRDPGFKFRLDEAMQGLKRSYANGGQGIASGDTLKALDKWGQDYSSNEYAAANSRVTQANNDRFSRLQSLTGIGAAATGRADDALQSLTGNTNAAETNRANQSGALQQNAGKSLSELQTAQGGDLATLAGKTGDINATHDIAKANVDTKALSDIVGGLTPELTKLISLFTMGGK